MNHSTKNRTSKRGKTNLKIFYKQIRRYINDNRDKFFSYSAIKNNFIYIISLFFLCWIYNDLEPDIRRFLTINANKELHAIYKFITIHTSINVSFLILICTITCIICRKIWINVHYSMLTLTVGIFLLYILSFNEFWVYIKLPIINISYDKLFILIIYMILIIDFVKALVILYFNIQKHNSHKGQVFLTNDKTEILDETTIRRCYAKSIVKQLLNTDTKYESFALAITGDWGCGKTTFLMCMIEEIKITKKAYVMQFNPWNCKSPQSLIQDFFQQLNDTVARLYKPLEKSIYSYAYALTQMVINSDINLFFKLLLTPTEKSLAELKKDVDNGLKHLNKPIVIVIDDIDRLEKEELFETLRLIRNTGNFSNLTYVVVYDEKYVTQQLTNKGIYDGKLFLEKIFPAQVALPKVDLTDVYDVFKSELRSMVKHSDWINSCFDQLKPIEITNIKRALYTFRRAKHFARQLSMSAIFLYDNLGLQNFSLHDLLFIELLHYLSPALYDILTNNPKYFLSSKDHKNNRFHYIISAEGESNLDQFLTNKPEEKFKDTIISIFELLFNDTKKISPNSIKWTDKYINYICFGIPKNKVSDLEFSAMINSVTEEWDTNGMRSIIQSWCLSKSNPKDIKSIYDQFAKYHVNPNSKKEIIQFLQALFYWFEFIPQSNNKLILNEMSKAIYKSKYKDSEHESLRNLIWRKMNGLIKKNMHEKVANLCNQLYPISQKKESLLSTNELKQLLNTNIIHLLKSKNWDAINLVTEDGNKLNKVFTMSTIQINIKAQNSIYENPTVENVITLFASKSQKSTNIRQLEQEFRNLLYSGTIMGPRTDLQKNKLDKLFGTNNSIEYLKRFRSECFINS